MPVSTPVGPTDGPIGERASTVAERAVKRKRDVVHLLGAFGRPWCSARGWTTRDSAKVTCPDCRGGGA